MNTKFHRRSVAPIAMLAVAAAWIAPATAQNHAEGKLTVDGKSVAITQVYAYAVPGFFDKKKQDVVVLLCDTAVAPATARDVFARKDLFVAGKAHCVQQVVNTEKQVINFEVGHERFGRMGVGGASTEQVFEATRFDGKSIAGHSFTQGTQKSFDGVPYSYDIAFSATIEPKQ